MSLVYCNLNENWIKNNIYLITAFIFKWNGCWIMNVTILLLHFCVNETSVENVTIQWTIILFLWYLTHSTDVPQEMVTTEEPPPLHPNTPFLIMWEPYFSNKIFKRWNKALENIYSEVHGIQCIWLGKTYPTTAKNKNKKLWCVLLMT